MTESLQAIGLPGPLVPTAAALARPAIRLVSHPATEPGPLGSSRIGGLPDLPRDAAWPIRPGYHGVRSTKDADTEPAPLAFIAQLDFAALAASGVPHDLPLPTTGRLQLFYDLVRMPWGFDPAEHVGFKLVYDDSPIADLARADLPEELDELDDEGSIPELALVAEPVLTVPSASSPALRDLLDEDPLEAWYDWESEQWDAPEWNSHQVGGWPHVVQNDMTVECALLAAGHYTGDSVAYQDETVMAAARAAASDWVLLLQISSDDDGAMWGDSGFLYLWIRRDDLAANAFEKAILLLQSY